MIQPFRFLSPLSSTEIENFLTEILVPKFISLNEFSLPNKPVGASGEERSLFLLAIRALPEENVKGYNWLVFLDQDYLL